MSSLTQELESNMDFIYKREHEQEQTDSFYLTSDDDSLLEQFRTAEAEASHFNTTQYMSLESYESGIYNVASHSSSQFPRHLSTDTLSSNELAFDNHHHRNHPTTITTSQEAITSNDKSLEMNCKTLCRDLLKPIANKLAHKVLRKRTTKQQPSKQKFKFKVQFTSPTNISKAKLRVVPKLPSKSIESTRVPKDVNKLTSNCFSKCGDFVFYNI